MAVRNKKLGGTDIVYGEAGISSDDFNNTFDSVVDYGGLLFKQIANSIWAEDISSTTNLVEQYDNVVFDSLKNTSKTTTATTTSDVSTAYRILGGRQVYDGDFSTPTIDIDTTMWTESGSGDGSGDSYENGGYLYCQSVGNNTSWTETLSATGSSFTLSLPSSDATFYFHNVTYSASGGSGGLADTGDIYITNGSTSVKIIDAKATGLSDSLVSFEYNNSGNTIQAKINGSASGTPVDISSVTGTRYFKFVTYSASGTIGTDRTVYIRFSKVTKIYNGTITTFFSTALTSGTTITRAILVASNDNSGTHAFYLSADNGVNYELVTLNKAHIFTNTGTQLMVKIITTANSSVDRYVYHYAAIINMG